MCCSRGRTVKMGGQATHMAQGGMDEGLHSWQAGNWAGAQVGGRSGTQEAGTV